MNLPNILTEREPIDPKLAIGSSLKRPKELLSIVLLLYIISEEKDSIDFSIESENKIKIKSDLIKKLKLFFSELIVFNEEEFNKAVENSPLIEMAIEPLQVTLQVYWKISKIKIIGSNSSSQERSHQRYPKLLSFTTNMDILMSILSDDDNQTTEKSKELLYCWFVNKGISSAINKLEDKLKRTLLIFTEETLFQIWDNDTPLIFQQEGIYNAINDKNQIINHRGNNAKERKGTMRNLWAVINKNLNPFLKISSNKDELEFNSNTSFDFFSSYKERVSNYLDLNPKSVEIKTVESEDETDLVDVEILNKIYYGAPGTGKSHKVNELLKGKEKRTERVTFHPEYDYASFIGGFKPITEKDPESGKEEINYKFVPQIFTNIYVDAWNDKDNQYYLVIEEINRGNCAEIFGDIFQLLDRNSDYSITPSNELKQYLVKELTSDDGIKGIENGKMKLPSNLNILATMNTSDQSLFPMDSAFKRRWDWEYIPINYDKSEENPSSNYQVVVSDSVSFSWLEFIEKVNTIIKENPNLGMDKCIGNYFIKAKDNSITIEEFINKAIFYLWNDVFKDEDDHIFEENTFYEDFFPIETKGKEKVLNILEKIGVNIPEKED